MPRIAVIGTIMRDRITTVEGETFESLGGILYNLVALAAADPEVVLRPHAFLSSEHRREVLDHILAGLGTIETEHLRANPEGTDFNVLEYVTTNSRRERKEIRTPGFTAGDLTGLGDCDAVVVNFISGHELDEAAFRHIRQHTHGLLYLDVHNLGKKRHDGVPVPGHVFHDWPRWVGQVDVVQANEWEAERFFGAAPRSEDDYREVVHQLLGVDGPLVAALTLGPKGVALGARTRPNSARIEYHRIPPMPNEHIVDTTGCGDSFSAGFVTEYLRSGSPLRAAVLGSTLSGLKCRVAGLDGMRRLSGIADAMAATYGSMLMEAVD